MATIGVTTDITLATDKSRSNIASFYKSISSDGVSLNSPITLSSGGGFEDIDVSNSNFIVVVADDYGLENESLNLRLTDSVGNSLTVVGVGFFILNFNNLTNVRIINSATQDIDVIVLR